MLELFENNNAGAQCLLSEHGPSANNHKASFDLGNYKQFYKSQASQRFLVVVDILIG